MSYIKVKWKHNFDDEPVWFFSELDSNRMEIRTLQIFGDGRCGYYDGHKEQELGTELGYEPVPDLKEIAEDSELEPFEITKTEFEKIWSQRRTLINPEQIE